MFTEESLENVVIEGEDDVYRRKPRKCSHRIPKRN